MTAQQRAAMQQVLDALEAAHDYLAGPQTRNNETDKAADERVRSAIATLTAALAEQGEAEPVATVLDEVWRATRKFPTWPTDPLHALAVLGEEFGELTKAALQLTYEPHKTSAEEVRTEAIQTAAMALRFVMSLDRYEYRRCEQHAQDATPSTAAQPEVVGDERELRRMLCSVYAGSAAYMDDDEAQDNRVQPCIDFMRDTPAQIAEKMANRARALLSNTKEKSHG